MRFEYKPAEKSYKKIDYSVLRLDNNAEEFVLNLSTNSLDQAQTAFLDINGKIVAHAFQFVKENSVFLVVRKSIEKDLEAHLKKYMRIGPTKLEKIETDVYHLFSDVDEFDSKIKLPVGFLTWNISKTDLKGYKTVSDNDYLLTRIAYNLSFQGIEFDNPMLLVINQDEVFSENKGCYLGQEIIARVLSRGSVPKSLRRLAFKLEPKQLTSANKNAGELKTVAYSEKHNLWLAFAIVNREIDRIDGGEFLDD